MNRHERRAARKHGAVVKIDRGRLQERDQNYGLAVGCYVCGRPHKASGFVHVCDSRSSIYAALCEPCLVSGDANDDILRKYLNAPALEVIDKGEATTEQIEALANKRDETEH